MIHGETTAARHVTFSFLIFAFAGFPQSSAWSQTPRKPAAVPNVAVRDHVSKNFLVHTDLSPDDAKDLLLRLEAMLSLISRYWGRPNTQTIEMYVVKDLKNWPANSLDPRGLPSIQNGAGITLSQTSFVGGQPVAAKAVVFAVADRGTPQHEAVHAYCALNFGRTGPVWYSEGMAEMGQYWQEKDVSVNCHPGVVKYLKSTEPKSLDELTADGQQTGDSWENYAWRWALCHLLANNSNYSTRFRPLGLDLLNGKPTSFEAVYGPMAREIIFEYEQFLKDFDRGYRADLCSWDWKTKPNKLAGVASAVSKIEAARGWQASRVHVLNGQSYKVSATGTWKVSKGGDPLTTSGDQHGNGKLLGAILTSERNGYKLSAPFEIGDVETFTAAQEGALVLRCQKPWTEIAENSGSMTIKIQLAP